MSREKLLSLKNLEKIKELSRELRSLQMEAQELIAEYRKKGDKLDRLTFSKSISLYNALVSRINEARELHKTSSTPTFTSLINNVTKTTNVLGEKISVIETLRKLDKLPEHSAQKKPKPLDSLRQETEALLIDARALDKAKTLQNKKSSHYFENKLMRIDQLILDKKPREAKEKLNSLKKEMTEERNHVVKSYSKNHLVPNMNDFEKKIKQERLKDELKGLREFSMFVRKNSISSSKQASKDIEDTGEIKNTNFKTSI